MLMYWYKRLSTACIHMDKHYGFEDWKEIIPYGRKRNNIIGVWLEERKIVLWIELIKECRDKLNM